MTDTIKPHPLAACKICGGITYRREAANQRCARTPRGHRCSGTGTLNGAPWTTCRGIGWNLAGPWSF